MNRDHIGGFLLGLCMGGSLALLFAPSSGKKTRAQIAQATAEGVSQAKDTVRDSARSLVERGKDALSRTKESAAAAAAD